MNPAVLQILQTCKEMFLVGALGLPILVALFRFVGLASWPLSVVGAVAVWISVPSVWCAGILWAAL
jgi:hypothetical protein